MSGERTEQATEQRKKKARETGDIVRSRELIGAVSLLAGLLILKGVAGHFAVLWRTCFQRIVDLSTRAFPTPDELLAASMRQLIPVMLPVTAMMAASVGAALVAGGLQTGGLQLNVKTLEPKLSRFSPLSNAKSMFSARSAVRFAKSMLPAGAIAVIGYRLLHESLLTYPVMSATRLPETLAGAYTLAVDAAWISVGWSALDYFMEWRSWNQRLKMSKQEIKEEVRQSNGNPQVKGRMRTLQRAMRRRRVKADMSRASVVITNPTHYAVALEFSFETMAAPKVLSKGRDLFAREIRNEARWHGVPIMENPPLARSLYKSVPEGQPIPYELYTAVAAILAFLFREERERAAREEVRRHNQRASAYSAGTASASLRLHFALPHRIDLGTEPLAQEI